MARKDTLEGMAETFYRRRLKFKELLDNVDIMKSDVAVLKDELSYVIRDAEDREARMKTEIAELKRKVSGEERG